MNGIKFWCYHAGHVLGASMFMIEIAGVKVRDILHAEFGTRCNIGTSLAS